MRECIFFSVFVVWNNAEGLKPFSSGIRHFDRYRSLLEGEKVGWPSDCCAQSRGRDERPV